MMSTTFIPVFLYHSLAVFTNEKKSNKKFIIGGYIVSTILSVMSFSHYSIVADVERRMDFQFWPVPGPLFSIHFITFCLFTFKVFDILLITLKTANGVYREQIGYLLIALILSFGGGMTNYFLFFNIHILPYGNILVSIYPIMVAYIILRFNFMDINLAFRYATIYSFFALLLGIPICALIWWVQSWILSSTLLIGAILLSPYLFMRLKSKLTFMVDQLPLFKGRYERLKNLQKHKNAIAQSLTLGEWETGLVQAVNELFDPASAHVLHLNDGSNDPMSMKLAQDRNVLIRDLLKQMQGEEDVARAMEDAGAEICMPLFMKGRLVSILLIAQKKGGEMYNDLDLAALWGLVKSAEEALRGILTRDEIIKKERLAAIGEMASIVGHEIRNPLAVIGNSIYYLEQKFPELFKNDAAAKHFNNMNAQVRSANKIIEDILDYARSRELALERGSINDLISKTLSVIVIPKNIRQALNLSKDISATLFDPEEMTQVITNVIRNAIEAMPEGGTLSIETAPHQEGIEVRVKDTGSGISKENLDKIFEPLFTTKTKGTGLGMAIVKKIIDRHKGTISINSEPGKGTAVTIRV